MMRQLPLSAWRQAALLVCVLAAACGGNETTEPTNQGSTNQGSTNQGPPGEPGEDAAIALVATEDIAPGEECELGGVRVSTGVDANRNGVLDADEAASESTTVLCRSAGAQCPQAPVQITGLDGTEQVFVKGIESTPLQVQLDATAEVELRVLATDMIATMSDTPGEFTVTPTASGGPWRIGVVAFDGCTVDAETFVLGEVLRNLSYVRGFNTVRPHDVDISGPAGPLLTLASRAGSELVEIEVGPNALDFTSSLPNIMAPGDEVLDAMLDAEYDIVTYAGVEAGAFGLKWLFLESDATPSATEARLRFINLHRSVAQADVRVLGAAPTAFDDLASGQPAPVQPTAPGFAVGVDVDGDGTDDHNFVFSDRLTTAATVANVYLVEDADTSAAPTVGPVALVAQYIDEEGGTELGEEVGALPINFEGGAVPVYASLEGDSDWYIATDQASSGNHAMRSGWVVNQQVSRLRLKVAVPTDGTLSFDWKAKGRRLEKLYFCLPGVSPCDRYTNTALITVDINGEDRPWETVSVPLTAGVHELVWEFRVGDYRLASEDIGGWIDNLKFTTGAP